MKTILIVETSDLTPRPLSQSITELGYKPLFLIALGEHAGDVQSALCECPVRYEAGWLDDESLLQLTEKDDSIAGILTLADLYVAPAARLARCRGVKGLAPDIAELNSKAVLQQTMTAFCPTGLVFNTPPTDADRGALQTLLASASKLRIKPAWGTGGALQSTIADLEELNSFLDRCPARCWVAQAYLPPSRYGLYSLEGFVHQGRLHEVGISRRRRRGTTETGTFFPVFSDERITSSARDRMRETIQTACARLPVAPEAQNFWFHAEFLIGSDGDVFWIDPNLGRIGGAAILWHLALSMSVDPALVARHFVSLTLGLAPLPHLPEPRIETESILYILDTPVTVSRVDASDCRLPVHVCLTDPGMAVGEYAPDNWDVIGIAVGRADQNIPAEVDKIRIHSADGRVLQPCY